MAGFEIDAFSTGNDPGPSRTRRVGAVALLLAAALIGWYKVRPAMNGDADADATSAKAVPRIESVTSGLSTTVGAAATDSSTTTPDTSMMSMTSVTESTTDPQSVSATTEAPSSTDAPVSTDAPSSTDAPVSTAPVSNASTSNTPTTAPVSPPLGTLPDGTPEPVVVVLELEQATMRGSVPDVAAVMRIAQFVRQFAGTDVPIINELTIDPNVPSDVGLHLVDLTTTPFGEGSTKVGPELAGGLDRLVELLGRYPNTTLLVVGHSDRRGDDQENLELSQDRAASAVAYITSHGIAGTRVSSRGVGAEDPVATTDDEPSIAANRRVEFIVYGLFLA